jgi:uncharacterized membrane protein
MSNTLYEKLVNLLSVIPVIIFMTLANLIISFVVAFVVFVQLLTVAGWSRNVSMVVGILVAAAIHAYIYAIPGLRNYVNTRSKQQ